MYGVRGARGMELRAGRYAFNLGLKEFGPLLGVGDLALKLMPMTIKMKITLNLTARTFTSYADQPTRVEERKGQFLYIIEKCPVCWGRHTGRAGCFIAQGILEEALSWVTGGRNFKVEELECRANGGNECVWAIDKDPVD
jgi:predicted hydrocarbon binding protein